MRAAALPSSILSTVSVIFDRVQRGLPIGPFRLAPRADIPPAPVYEWHTLSECCALGKGRSILISGHAHPLDFFPTPKRALLPHYVAKHLAAVAFSPARRHPHI